MRQTLELYKNRAELSRIVFDDEVIALSDGIYQITDEIINAIKTCDISDYNATHVEIING
jgi:hypothetical protein